jgi:hypothetical protein
MNTRESGHPGAEEERKAEQHLTRPQAEQSVDRMFDQVKAIEDYTHSAERWAKIWMHDYVAGKITKEELMANLQSEVDKLEQKNEFKQYT